ncbi:MAG: DUF5658 family protein [Bacillota bacterium]
MAHLRITLISLGVFNAIDYMLTLRCLEGGLLEGNPIMAPIVGTAWFPLIKVILVPLGLYMIWKVRYQIGTIARASVLLATGVYAGLMWYFWMVFSWGLVS